MSRRLWTGFGLGVVLSGLYGVAMAAEPAKDFTFRLVKPPPPGTTKFINIHVEPPTTPPPVIELVGAKGAQGWFWQAISPSLSAAGPGRFQKAADRIANSAQGRAIVTPRLEDMKKVADAYGTQIMLATVGKRISPALVLAMIGTESTGDHRAKSRAGAVGLMQLMPATAARFGVTDISDPGQNIRGGVDYLASLLKQFQGDPILALAAYNAGENAVLDNDGVPDFPETRTYVPKVIAAFQVAKGLCKTPPELYSDGCVFLTGNSN